MKRLIAAVLCLILLLGSLPALAELENSSAAIVIDGVRAAFFDGANNYLPILQQDGLVYAPVESLAQNLGLEVSADPESLAVTIKGVRSAFFDEDGAFLPAVNVDGNVYVPLVAFAESAGIAISVDGDTYTLTREGEAPVAEAPEEEYAEPEFYIINLTPSNFGEYFSYSFEVTDYKTWQEKYNWNGSYLVFQHYSYDCTLTCDAKRSFEFGDVQFDISSQSTHECLNGNYAYASFHDVFMPQSGHVTKTDHAEAEYISPLVMTYEPDFLTFGLFTTFSNVKGYIKIPASEIRDELRKKYSDAITALENGMYADSIEQFDFLAEIGYRDSAEQAKLAREKETEAKAQADAEAYETALEQIEAGEFDEAIAALEKLAENNYKDSAAQLERARQTKTEAIYQEALQLEIDGEYAKAIEKFKACIDYLDAAERAAACRDSLYGDRFQQAREMESRFEYDKALDLYQELDINGDLADQIAHIESRRADLIWKKAFNRTSVFHSGRALIKKDDLWGYIDTSGEVVIPIQFKNAADFSDELALVKGEEANRSTYIDLDGNVAMPDSTFTLLPDGSFFSNGLAPVTENDKIGYIDTSFNVVIPAIYDGDYYSRFQDGYALVKLNKSHVFVDGTGQNTIDPKGIATPFTEGLAMVKNGKCGYIDKTGALMIDYLFDSASQFHEGKAYAVYKGTPYFIDTQGKLVLQLQQSYDKVNGFSEGRAIVQQGKRENSRYGAIDESGALVIPIEYEDLKYLGEGFHEGTIAAKKDGRWGIIDVDGNEVIPIQYDDVFPYNEGYCIVMQDGYYGVFDAEGKLVS